MERSNASPRRAGTVRPSRPAWMRIASVVTALVFALACHSWHAVPLKKVEAGQSVTQNVRIRVHLEGEQQSVVLRVQSVNFPEVVGEREPASAGLETIDLRRATKVEVWSLSGWRTLGLVTGVAALTLIIVALTKSSCPFVYLDDGSGLRFVGEAYSGATSRATQRDDLLPLPGVGMHPALVLSNEAEETQFTDELELVVVDHAPGRRALATQDAGLLLAGAATPPLSAQDLEGSDALALVRDADGRSWRTDLQAASRRRDPQAREGLVLTFFVPEAGNPVALELDAGNTAWLDIVFGRFFALFGDRLEWYLDRADRPGSRSEALAWRQREGVDLRVEVERSGRWEPVAVVPTVGPASLRHFAVPLPSVTGPQVRVRLTGGLGFWEVDRAALATVDCETPHPVRYAPDRARDGDGADVRMLLASADGRYQALENRGERVDLSFDLPPLAPGLERDAFLHTSGYYRIHRPQQAELSRGTLYRLRDEPGSLSRFSLDLYRQYEEVAGGPLAAQP